MTRKDYQLIAEAVVRANERFGAWDDPDASPEHGVEAVVEELCELLLHDNPRFDSALFREACDV